MTSSSLIHGATDPHTLTATSGPVKPSFMATPPMRDGPPVAEEGGRLPSHMTVVHDPLKAMSVLEPGGLDGCRMHHRVSVEDTAKAAGCLYAQNGGFFNTKSGECLGNVVSSGRVVRDSGGVQNAQFGIRSDGTLVFG
ncbi:hypothetical protein GOODEAATRI_005068 [Goodea atripinnis]|uniref:Uncharacterized protein n=1 Tax=Goodea atripinnis TaxID=208336 RepID=A0ABV0MSE2_9TELE